MIWSFLYRVACGAFQLCALRLRSSERKELEMLDGYSNPEMPTV
jgi:hypothetical protein